MGGAFVGTWTVGKQMVFIETAVFTRQVRQLLTDEEYRLLQNELVLRPEAGAIIQGSGGLRKVRWSMQGRGKRGGTRVIYYWAPRHDQIVMLLIYPKNVQDDLTPSQLKILRQVVEDEYR
jgi:mRNA-degrading endonuclease RelE of RelBE toxin-antitoxin system